MAFKKYDRQVGVDCRQVNEFCIGDTIRFHNEYTDQKGIGKITAFAQADYEPLVWFKNEDGEHHSVHLGWCVKLYPVHERHMLHEYRVDDIFGKGVTYTCTPIKPEEFITTSPYLKKAGHTVLYKFLPSNVMSEDYWALWRVLRAIVVNEPTSSDEEEIAKVNALICINSRLPKEIK